VTGHNDKQQVCAHYLTNVNSQSLYKTVEWRGMRLWSYLF